MSDSKTITLDGKEVEVEDLMEVYDVVDIKITEEGVVVSTIKDDD